MNKYVYEKINPELAESSVRLNEVLFHNANGYIGVRYDFEEGYPEDSELSTGQYVNGFYDYLDVRQPENLFGLSNQEQIMVNVANTQTIKLYLDDEDFSMYKGTVLKSRLSLNMEKGVTVREVLWRSPSGREIHLNITRMASFSQLPLFTIEYEVKPVNFSCKVVLESVHDGCVENYSDPKDPRMLSEKASFTNPVSCEIRDGASYISSATAKSGLMFCSCVKNILSQDCQMEFSVSDSQSKCTLSTEAREGEKFTLKKYAVFCDSIRYEDFKEQAVAEMEKATAAPLQELYEQQEKLLRNYWECCSADIEGDDDLDMAIRFNQYHLFQSAVRERYGNIPAKGLSGDGYGGNYFWDSEMYDQHYLRITIPSITRNLLAYRYTTLEAARENARILGHTKGALYPWRTINGRESSGYFPSGSAQYHINGDIVYSIVSYYLATKDWDYILLEGAEIVLETARVWIEMGNYFGDKFYINTVTGPDEYTCIVNNNYFTNALAQHNLRWACKFYDCLKEDDRFKEMAEKIWLTESEIADFRKASEAMYLPYDETLKINPQDDSFLQKKNWDIRSIPKERFPLLLNYHPLHIYRHQICKQADTVMAHFILEDIQSNETMKNSFMYYEKITTHDSSLSKPVFGIMAARLGIEEKALEYFRDSAMLDLTDINGNTNDGIHVANMAGSLMVLVYGFAGFRLKENGIYFEPFLPQAWSGYSFKVEYEDSCISVRVENQKCFFLLKKGNAKLIHVYGKEYLLETNVIVKMRSN